MRDFTQQRRQISLRPLLVLFWCATALALWLPCTAAPTIDELYQRCQVDLPPVDLVVLIDGSGSMTGPKYDTVRKVTGEFVKSLGPSERLHLRLFAGTVSSPLESSGAEAAGKVDEYLPAQPLPGTGTDIALALAKGIEFLNRDGASRTQALFLLTDGTHQPPADSPGLSWETLRKRARGIRNQELIVYGVGLGQSTDINVLRQVFPPEAVEIVAGKPSLVKDVLNRFRDQLRREALRRVLTDDLRDGSVAITLNRQAKKTGGGSYATAVEIKNHYRYLGVSVSEFGLQATPDEDITSTASLSGLQDQGTLAPGESWTGTLTIKVAPGASRWRLPPVVRKSAVPLHFSADSDFAEQAVLRDLGFDGASLDTHWQGTDGKLTVSVTSGFPILALLLFVVLGIGLARGWKQLRVYDRPETMFGTLNLNGFTPTDLVAFPLTGVVIGTDAGETQVMLGAPTKPLAQLVMEEEGDQAYIAIEPLPTGAVASVEVDGVPLTGRQRLVIADDAAGLKVQLAKAFFTINESLQLQIRTSHPALFGLSFIGLIVVLWYFWAHSSLVQVHF
ncbi:MAG: vWA domain-containing protein [Armatimonadota bacterium]